MAGSNMRWVNSIRLMPITAIAAIAVICLFSPSNSGLAAAKNNRVALVIGNSDYRSSGIGFLRNPVKDARLIANTLREVGFRVLDHYDLNRRSINRVTREFANALNSAGPGSVGVFYFAGHGVQYEGQNYLIPVNVDIEHENEVEDEAVSLRRVFGAMKKSTSRLNIMIVDACRNNPFARSFRSASRGLARSNPPTGSLVAYSTAPGTVAVDGDGENSPFATALSKAMLQPNLPALMMFRQIRNEVMAATDDIQVPWTEESLTGDPFYFRKDLTRLTNTGLSRPGQLAPSSAELIYWNQIKDSGNLNAYRSFLRAFPTGKMAEKAREKLQYPGSIRSHQPAVEAPVPTAPAHVRPRQKFRMPPP